MAQLECALKSQISRQAGLRQYQEVKNDKLTQMLLDSWKCIKDFDDLESLAWDYVEGFLVWKQCNSALLGIKTNLKEQVNKKGEKVLYHYTSNNCYYGTVKQLGTEPVFYDGYFRITRKDFKFNPLKLKKAKTICELFEPETSQ